MCKSDQNDTKSWKVEFSVLMRPKTQLIILVQDKSILFHVHRICLYLLEKQRFLLFIGVLWRDDHLGLYAPSKDSPKSQAPAWHFTVKDLTEPEWSPTNIFKHCMSPAASSNSYLCKWFPLNSASSVQAQQAAWSCFHLDPAPGPWGWCLHSKS